MGIQEKEIVELYREMQAERGGAKITSDGIATLTAARVLKRVMEKCCIEVCESIEASQPKYELKLTLHQANAVIDMDDIVEGIGPPTEEAFQGWDELLTQAEILTGRKAYGSE